VLRYILSLRNTQFPNFPIFTLVANISAVAVDLIIVIVVNEVVNWSANQLYVSQIISGVVMTGFSGCLSTVSTFMLELYQLPVKHSWKYGVVSITLAQVLLITIVGGFVWGMFNCLYSTLVIFDSFPIININKFTSLPTYSPPQMI